MPDRQWVAHNPERGMIFHIQLGTNSYVMRIKDVVPVAEDDWRYAELGTTAKVYISYAYRCKTLEQQTEQGWDSSTSYHFPQDWEDLILAGGTRKVKLLEETTAVWEV